MSAPRVSVVIPTFNRARLLFEAIDSVRAQTLADFELIVVDDGSEIDLASRVAARYRDDSRVRTIRQPNAGTAAARQTGLEAARAPYLALLDDDDRYLPDCLASQAAFLDEHPEVDLVVCNARAETDTGVAIPSLFDLEGWSPPVSFASFAQLSWLWPSTMAMRTEQARQLGFSSEFRFAEDRHFLYRLLAVGKRVGANRELLVVYRVHESTSDVPMKSRSRVQCASEQLEISRRFARHMPRSRPVLGRDHKRLALALVEEGRWRDARPHLRGWWLNKPDSFRALRLLARSYLQ